MECKWIDYVRNTCLNGRTGFGGYSVSWKFFVSVFHQVSDERLGNYRKRWMRHTRAFCRKLRSRIGRLLKEYCNAWLRPRGLFVLRRSSQLTLIMRKGSQHEEAAWPQPGIAILFEQAPYSAS